MHKDSVYVFTFYHNTVVQELDTVFGRQTFKFIQVQVIKVINPNKHLISFEVFFQGDGEDKTLLGNFSLYPSDNPGNFIVPTQGKLQKSGKIILRLTLPPGVKSSDRIEITTSKIKFLSE